MSQRAAAKAATHDRIVATASKLMRQEGLAAASIPRVMRGAGLTVGGFYAHFKSKRAMDAEVLRTTLVEAWETMQGNEHGVGSGPWLAQWAHRYLSPEHRDASFAGCPLPATISELTRADRSTRGVLAEMLSEFVESAEAKVSAARGPRLRQQALLALAMCVGGVALARAMRGASLGDEVLAACRTWAEETAGADAGAEASASA